MSSSAPATTGKKLSKKTLFAYGLGDFASNLTNTFMGSYLSIFYTDVVGLAPIVVSTIMIIARIWDAVNDPMFGAIAERTNTKRGRFRPYIFYGTPWVFSKLLMAAASMTQPRNSSFPISPRSPAAAVWMSSTQCCAVRLTRIFPLSSAVWCLSPTARL